jgi:hypothetical protein
MSSAAAGDFAHPTREGDVLGFSAAPRVDIIIAAFGSIRGIAMRDWWLLARQPQVRRLFALTSLLALWPCWPAFAQVAVSTSAEVASYVGADRTEKLLAGARKAGTVTVYTSANLEDMAVLTSVFEK